MSDNHKYYYIKLKDGYFDRDNIKAVEAQENGYLYSLIILKLYLKSAKYDGKLMMTDRIPFNPDNVEVLAKVINHNVSQVRDAIRIGVDMDLLCIVDSGDIWMTDIQDFIGQSSTEADRKRKYRHQLGQMSGHLSDKIGTDVPDGTNVHENVGQISTRVLESRDSESRDSDKEQEPPLFPEPDQDEAPFANPPSNGYRFSESEFVAFYTAYPKHINRKAALAKYKTVRKSGITQEQLLAGVSRYKAYIQAEKTDDRYVCGPEVWLNKGRWDDEYETTKPQYSGTEEEMRAKYTTAF